MVWLDQLRYIGYPTYPCRQAQIFEGVRMTEFVERKVLGITLRPRTHVPATVHVAEETAAQKEEMLRAIRLVISRHRQVLEALKDR